MFQSGPSGFNEKTLIELIIMMNNVFGTLPIGTD